jgi:hypothetical protein
MRDLTASAEDDLRLGDVVPIEGQVLAGEPAALVDQIIELADGAVEHLVLEFLAADGRELNEQMVILAARVRPRLA